MFHIDAVVTAGAYVRLENFVLFMVGLTPNRDRLGVVRLGGHREQSELPWQCAAREVEEEASILIVPIHPPATYSLSLDTDPLSISVEPPGATAGFETPPILVVPRRQASPQPLSIMFLAQTECVPTPAHEASGLLLLRREDVQRIVEGSMTLRDYIDHGGWAILHDALPVDLPLEPFLQLRVLAHLIDKHPTIFGLD